MSSIILTVDGRELHVPRTIKPSTRLIDVLRYEAGSKVGAISCACMLVTSKRTTHDVSVVGHAGAETGMR
jgi:hypothetical protein